jgi:hypothetical protein
MSDVLPVARPDDAEKGLTPVALARYVEGARDWLKQEHDIAQLEQAKTELDAVSVLVRSHDDLTAQYAALEEVRVRLERRLGEVLRSQKRNTGARKPRSPGAHRARAEPPGPESKPLKDQPISRGRAARAKALASVPDEDFEAALQRGLEEGKLSGAQILRDTAVPGSPLVARVWVSLSPETAQKARLAADDAGYSLTEWIRGLVEREVEQARPKRATTAVPAAIKKAAGSEKCTHPPHNRSKGICMRCGEKITSKGS